MNNDHPTGPPSPRFTPLPGHLKPLREGASEEQWRFFMQEAVALYANLSHEHNHNWPAIIAAIKEIREELNRARRDRGELDDRVEALRAETARNAADLARHDARITALEQPTMRNELPSHHDWSEELQRLSSELTARVKDKRDPMTSDRAKAIAADVVRTAEDAHELGQWRLRKGWVQRIGTKVVEWAVIAVLAYLASRLIPR
jgi:hypothetical protein